MSASLTRKPESLEQCTTAQLEDLDYLACSLSFDYWLSRYGHMRDEEGTVVGPGIQQWPKQVEYTRRLRSGEWLICGKARREGLSWLVAHADVYDMIFESNVGLGVIAQDDPWAMFHLDRRRWLYNQQPAHIRRRAVPVIGKDNKHMLGLSNGSTFSAYPCTEKQARGAGGKRITLEEFAQFDGAAEVYAAVYGAVRDRGQLVIISTGKGEGGEFHAKWEEAGAGHSKLQQFFIGCFDRPDRAPDFRDGMTALEKQEFPITPDEMFLTSGDKRYDLVILAWLAERYKIEPLRVEQNGNLKIWHEPEPGHTYAIGADVADGGGDACAASVRDLDTNEQAASYVSFTNAAGDFGAFCCDLGKRYNWAYLGIERNNAGVASLDRAEELKYPRLMYVKHFHPDSDSAKSGWITNSNTRSALIDRLGDVLGDYPAPLIHDAAFYQQARAFGWYKGRWDHPDGGHDDLIFAEGIIEQIRHSMGNVQEPDLIVYRNGNRIEQSR